MPVDAGPHSDAASDVEAQLLVSVLRSVDGRVEGTIQNLAAEVQIPFSGTLELLRAFEDAVGGGAS